MANNITHPETEQQQMHYTPILFPDGVQYTSEEVGWVVNDYLARAEQSIMVRRNSARYHTKLRAGFNIDNVEEKVQVERTEKEKFLTKVRSCNDYNWIIAVVMVRKEIDLMHSLRIKIFDTRPKGGSTFDIMINHINEVLRNTKSTYADRARAEYYRKVINEISKDWTPGTAKYIPTSVNIQNNYNSGAPQKEEPKPEPINIKDIRESLK